MEVYYPNIFFGKDGYSFTEDRNSKITLNFLPGRHSSPIAGHFSFLKQGVWFALTAVPWGREGLQMRSLG